MNDKIADAGSAVKGSKPEPVVGQVWRWANLREVRIERLDHYSVHMVFFVGGTCTDIDSLVNGASWSCIGIETPNGRVMVGERRLSSEGSPIRKVVGIGNDGMVWMLWEGEGGLGPTTWPAEYVATWPLVPTPPAKADGSPAGWDVVEFNGIAFPVGSLEKAAEQGVRQYATREDIYSNRLDSAPLTAQTFHDAIADAQAEIEATVGFVNPLDPVARIRAIAGDGAIVNIYAGGHISVVLPAGTDKRKRDKVWARALGALPGNACLTVDIEPPPDPRAERETRRRAIDKILAEDARRFPAFATARKRAIVAHVERNEGINSPSYVPTVLEWIHSYERVRGGLSKPSAESWRLAVTLFGWDLADLYERARSL